MNKIYDKITQLEQESSAEIVVFKHSQSSHYPDIDLLLSIVVAIVVFTVQMIIPAEIDPYTIYFITLAGFVVGYLIGRFVKPLKSLLINKKRKNRTVEIYARALFQKGKIYLTQKNIGVMLFCSDLEKIATIIVDNGVENAVPESEFEVIRNSLSKIYSDNNVEKNIVNSLDVIGKILKTYLPPSEIKINEIPDDLTIEL